MAYSWFQFAIRPMTTFLLLLAATVLAAWIVGISSLRRPFLPPSTSFNKSAAYFLGCLLWLASTLLVFFAAALSINVTVIAISLGFSLTFFILALVLIHKQRIAQGLLAAAAPLPLLLFLAFEVTPLLNNHIIPMLESEPAEFTAACKSVGASYLRSPATPVHSIAYRWIGDSKRDYVRYEIGRYGRIGGMDGGGFGKRYPRLEEALNFKMHEGATYQERVTSADIQVTYRVSPESELRKAPIHQGLVTRELTVTDQRDGQVLATLVYVVDLSDRRICGPIVDNELSENTFLAKALALE